MLEDKIKLLKDSITRTRVITLHPLKQEKFVDFLLEIESTLGIEIRVVQAFRTFSEQNAEYAKGRSAPGKIVTAAKGGESFHCYGLAIDCVPMINGIPNWTYDFLKLKKISDKYGFTWGGQWKDYDHFEDNLGRGPHGWHILLERWNAGKVKDGYLTDIS